MPSILLVETGVDLRSMAGSLAESGFELAYEGSGPDALERIRSFQPDAVVLNVSEAEVPALIAKLRAASSRIRIVDVSSRALASAAAPAIDADATLRAPLDAAVLADMIWRLIEETPPTQSRRTTQ